MLQSHDELPPESADERPWYAGTTRYQWFVLLIASLGWIFDVFEGQIFVASMQEAMPSLTPEGTPASRISFYNNVAFAAFLVGGSLGGIAFGMLSDRIGRKRALSLTILFYSVFTCLSAFSQAWWHLAGMRFLVALGVGGEWAVASALVAETFSPRSRAHVGSIFHASSVLGAYLAIAAGTFLIGNASLQAWALNDSPQWLRDIVDPTSLPWRFGFAVGLLPALMVIWIRRGMNESESWQVAVARAADQGLSMGAITDLFKRPLLARTLIAVALATIGLATYWSVHIYGKDVMRELALRAYAPQNPAQTRNQPFVESPAVKSAIKRQEMLGMFLVTSGGGAGLLSFGPISQRLGRRGAFLLFHAGGAAAGVALFQIAWTSAAALMAALSLFGFLTLGMHAGYAIYFPELFPTRLRGTGAGFCFNAGRLLAAPVILVIGWLQHQQNIALADVAAACSLIFLAGTVLLLGAPETRGRELAE